MPVRRAFAREEEERRAFAEHIMGRDKAVLTGLIGALQQMVGIQGMSPGSTTTAAAAGVAQVSAEQWISVGLARLSALDKEASNFAKVARRSVTFADALEKGHQIDSSS